MDKNIKGFVRLDFVLVFNTVSSESINISIFLEISKINAFIHV